MHDFVPLEAFVRGAARPTPPATSAPATPIEPTVEPSGEASRELARSLARELAFARLAALEAFERARVMLLERFARDVLARELALAPVALDALARAALEAFRSAEPVRVRVAPGDVFALDLDIAIVEDPSLAPGDLAIEVRDGELDARLHVRAARALALAAHALA